MFCLSVIRVIRKNSLNNKIINIAKQPATFFHTTSLLSRQEFEDVEAVKSVEENLFENSKHLSSFVSKRELLQDFNKQKFYGRPNNNRRNDKTAVTTKKTTVSPPAIKTLPVKKPSEPIIDPEIGFRYTKLQRSDKTFQQLMLLVKSKRHRHIDHLLLLEGRRLILDAINCGLPLKYLVFSDIEQLKLVAKDAPKDVTCYKVSQGDLSFWSTLTTCPGLIAIFSKPVDMSQIWKPQDYFPIIVICDQIREPNNVGGIIRACAALPVEKIILTKGCADHWDTKALRGGAGAQFLIPTMGPMPWDSIYSMLPPNYNVLIAENSRRNVRRALGPNEMHRFLAYTDMPQESRCILVIGGETEGVSDEAYNLLKTANGHCVHIPLANNIDSLNTSTALAILLFELKKQMTCIKAGTISEDGEQQ